MELSKLNVPNGCFFRKKESFEYTTGYNVYDVELFTNQDGTCYAVGVPQSGRLIVYGSPVMSKPNEAIQTVIDKIHREGLEEHDAVKSST